MDDPRILRLEAVLAGHRARGLPREPESREAAVALLLRPRQRLELLLIKRAEVAGDPWSGHMALPGGRRDLRDPDLHATAVRETEEETGIGAPLHPLGALDEVAPGSRRLPPLVIAPFVFGVPADVVASPDPREVEAALWVPLDELRAEGAASELVLEIEGMRRTFPSIAYGEHVIWGLTHRILGQFLELAARAGISA